MAESITYKMLVDWAGERTVREARAIMERGLVARAEYAPPFIRGVVMWGQRSLQTALRILPDGKVENQCPCRDNRERGLVCTHIMAVGLVLVRRSTDPLREQKYREELRRAARLAGRWDQKVIRRGQPDAPGVRPAHLHLGLAPDWETTRRTGKYGIACRLSVDGADYDPATLPADMAICLPRAEDNLLYVLEDIAGGRPDGRMELSATDFCNILKLCANGNLTLDTGHGDQAWVHAEPQSSRLHLDLDRENGELILVLHTDLPLEHAGRFPQYVLSSDSGWAYLDKHFWPLKSVLPEPLHGIYSEPVIIPRPSVPAFLKRELPALQHFLPLTAEVSADLLTLEKAKPKFQLSIRGSPASLAGVLHAIYGDHRLVAGRGGAGDDFAIPDSTDLLRYLVRHPEAESAALRQLARAGFHGEHGDSLSRLIGCRAVLNFLGGTLPALRRQGWNVTLEGRIAATMEQMDVAVPVVRIREAKNIDAFEIDWVFEDCQGRRLEEAEIQRALRKGDAFLETSGDTSILLDADAITSLTAVFKDCAARAGERPGSMRLPGAYAAYVRAALDALDGIDVEAPPSWRERTAVQNRSVDPAMPPLSPAIEQQLRDYQKAGVAWLRMLEAYGFCGILADEMGLGKTVQALVWLSLPRVHPEAADKPALIVCPSSLVENWLLEANRFVPELKTVTVSGTDRHKHWETLSQYDLVITSYALLRRDEDYYRKLSFSVMLLDEAQHIKNRSTQSALAAKRLHAHHRLVLTGTPIENNVMDLWSIMDFLMPGYLGDHTAFRGNYEIPMQRGGQESETAVWRLRRKLHPFLLRRLKTDVATDLPARITRVAVCALGAEQRRLYTDLLESSRRRLQDLVAAQGFQRSRMEILKTLLRLRQICCHPGLLKGNEACPNVPSAKTDLFFELLDEAIDGDHRVLVFSQFVSMLRIIQTECRRRNLEYCYLDGSIPPGDRMAIVRRFNTERSIPLFLISLKAGGTGLNLTGADMVIHYDPWWNPAVEDQATDRAHRIGQKRTVYSVKLIARNTIEDRVLEMQRRKQAVIDATIVSDKAIVESMTWHDIQEILNL